MDTCIGGTPNEIIKSGVEEGRACLQNGSVEATSLKAEVVSVFCH